MTDKGRYEPISGERDGLIRWRHQEDFEVDGITYREPTGYYGEQTVRPMISVLRDSEFCGAWRPRMDKPPPPDKLIDQWIRIGPEEFYEFQYEQGVDF